MFYVLGPNAMQGMADFGLSVYLAVTDVDHVMVIY